MSFRELFQAVSQRQQHTPNSATIRTILSSSPEFEFRKSIGKWSLNPQTASEIGARAVRRFGLAAQEAPEAEGKAPVVSTPPSLVEMIAHHRRDLQALRSRYLSEGDRFLEG
jgi:hypothetical protein